jgi:arabinosaccharide transport system substrate-binding protein
MEVLVLQAGGRFFDENGRPDIDSEVNARVLATLVSWCYGPGRICAEAPEFSASGNRLILDGYVLAALMPDWLCNVWKNEIPQLAGKVKLMPIPAWRRGGLRTSVRGGTMLGFSRDAGDFDEMWAFASYLYLSRDLARQLYRAGDIVTPVKSLWDDPIYDEPDPYFGGQKKGRMYLNLAPSVPVRASSPYNRTAQLRMQDALVALGEYARERSVWQVDALVPEARVLLERAQRSVERELERNVFLRAREKGRI